MKVFLSWSGSQSHRVALIFRDWLPSVIQEITPYVSSEDIDKGARWSTDIAKELEDSTFGVLCVTRDNLKTPWLNFEAGALSKTMEKSFVSPFLFNIKRSEINGPILQFQSTIFDRNDLKKLVKTLNKACDINGLSDERLNKAFDVWYPNLEDQLNSLLGESTNEEPAEPEIATPGTNEILEEILDLTRVNQKLIRNPDGAIKEYLDDIRAMLKDQGHRIESSEPLSRKLRRFHPSIVEEIVLMGSGGDKGGLNTKYVSFQIMLSLTRTTMPWIYDVGMELISILKSRKSSAEKRHAIHQFYQLLETSTSHPIMIDIIHRDKEMHMFYRELPYMMKHMLERDTHDV